MSNKRWKEAQISEKRCWYSIKQEVSSKDYLNKKKEYWNKIFNKTKKIIPIDDSKSFLDFGCGPTGIWLKYPEKRNLTSLDPLIGEYLKINQTFKKSGGIFINSKIENFEGNKFDYIFGFNALDHVKSIKDSLNKISGLMGKGSFLVISVNCHNLPFFQRIMLKTSFIFDKPHPHQYSLSQYQTFLKRSGFNILGVTNIDDEVDFMFNFKKTRKNLKFLIRKFFYPFSILFLLGYKLYGKKEEKTVYSSYLIISNLKKWADEKAI